MDVEATEISSDLQVMNLEATVENDGNGIVSINSFPDEILIKILRYINNPYTWLRCERSCKAFYRVLSDDDIWSSCFRATTNFSSFATTKRENTFIHLGLRNITTYQKGIGSNLIVDTLGASGTREFIQGIVENGCIKINGSTRGLTPRRHKFLVRGDTLGLMVELIQSYVVEMLESVHRIALHSSEGRLCQNCRSYPQVTLKDFKLFEYIKGKDYYLNRAKRMDMYDSVYFFDFADASEHPSKTTLVRKLAFRAGIVKLTDDAFDHTWKEIICLLACLLERAVATFLCREEDHVQPEYCSAKDIDIRRDVPPSNIINGCLHHIIIPLFVEDSAKSLGLNRVYGAGSRDPCYCCWLAEDGKSVKQEVGEAILSYMTMPISHVIGLVDDDESDYDPNDDGEDEGDDDDFLTDDEEEEV